MFTCDHCDFITEVYATLKTHQQTHEITYQDSSEIELDRSIFDDVTNVILNSHDHDWKLERVNNFTSDVDNFIHENGHQENQDIVQNFQDDEADIIMRDPRDIDITEDIHFSTNIQVPRDIETEIQAETDEAQEVCYDNVNGASVMAKVMSNKAFLGTKGTRSRKYSKVMYLLLY